MNSDGGGWDAAVWVILYNASPAERAELERIKASAKYGRVVEAGIPADALDAAILWTIRAGGDLVACWRKLGHAARKLREAAEALEALEALPAVFIGYDAGADELRGWEPWCKAGHPAELQTYLEKQAELYNYLAARYRAVAEGGGRPADYGRRLFIDVLDVVVKGFTGEPLVKLLVDLHNVIFPASMTDAETYHRELRLIRAKRRVGKNPCS